MQSKQDRKPVPPCRGPLRRARAAVAVPLILGLLLPVQGCYSYRPAEASSLAPAAEVRVVLQDEEFRRVAPGMQAGAPRRLEGDFVRLTEDTLAISVWIGSAYRGTPFEAARQEISIARADVVRVERRELSRWRTAAVAAGAAVVIASLIDGLGVVEVFGDRGGSGPPAPPEPALLPR